ncbi:hypothetical protein JNUCC1_01508 [Lentibacillus sp. JNUCC-1]|nr:hypothetical protein [Lentibacillus sp. JNUCC-1]
MIHTQTHEKVTDAHVVKALEENLAIGELEAQTHEFAKLL